MRHDMPSSPVSFAANVAKLPKNGLPVVIEADARQREALAGAHDLVSVERYRAELLVTNWKRNGVQVTGRVEADIVQECVLTLEPIESTISETVEGLFLPEDSKLGRAGFHEGGEILLDAEGPDGPETFSGNTIDVGALAEEFFAMAIDPYPRKPGASLPVKSVEMSRDEPDGPLQEKLRQLTRKS